MTKLIAYLNDKENLTFVAIMAGIILSTSITLAAAIAQTH